MVVSDEIFEQILSSTSDKLKESREILNKIIRRKLPKFVGYARLNEEDKSKKMREKLTETWKAAVNKLNCTNTAVSLKAYDFSVHVVDLGHGMKGKNPFQNIYFYSKRNNKTASCIEKYQLSSFLPETFTEELVRVYCHKPNDNMMEEADKCFKEWCESQFGL